MKKPLYLLAAAMLMLASCSKENDVAPGFGKLAINASVTPEVTLKATIDQSVVNGYNLTLTDNSDNSVKFNGTIASFTSPMELPAGTYTAVVKSEDFTAPAFSKPVYGVTKSDITIASNQTTEATLQAAQTNAGVKVAYDAQMATSFPGKTATTTITDANGSLLYASDESRIGYFTPGSVTVKVTFDGKEYTQSLTLAAGKNKEVTVNITPKPATPSLLNLTISVDETFEDKADSWTFDEKPVVVPGDGSSKEKAFTVAELIANQSAGTGKWVKGYIIGFATGSPYSLKTTGFSSTENTNVVLADSPTEKDKAKWAPAKLASGQTPDIRTAVGLYSNPTHIGKFVYLKGDPGAGFSVPAINNCKEFSF